MLSLEVFVVSEFLVVSYALSKLSLRVLHEKKEVIPNINLNAPNRHLLFPNPTTRLEVIVVGRFQNVLRNILYCRITELAVSVSCERAPYPFG